MVRNFITRIIAVGLLGSSIAVPTLIGILVKTNIINIKYYCKFLASLLQNVWWYKIWTKIISKKLYEIDFTLESLLFI